MIVRKASALLAAGLLAGLLACTGGEGGIGGSGITSQGAIDGFGSIFVNGMRYTLDDADILVEDQAGADALKLGMVVTVRAERGSGETGAARSVVYDHTLRGPVSAISGDPDDDLRSLTVLGFEVLVDSSMTVFDDVDYESVAVDDLVEVSGFVDAGGVIAASRLAKAGELQFGVSTVEFAGAVAGLSGDTFNIAGITVHTHAGTLLETSLADGAPVDIEGVLQAPGQVLAARITATGASLPDGDSELQGIVTGFVDNARFKVAGIPVQAGTAKFIPTTFSDDIGDGALVEVEGVVRGGVLYAERVKRRGGEVRVEAPVAAVDTGAGTLVLNVTPTATVTIVSGPLTSYRDDRDRLSNFSLADILPGDFMRIYGNGAHAQIDASRVRRIRSRNHLKLRGPAETGAFMPPDGGTLEVIGVSFAIDAGTGFMLDGVSVDADTFFSDPTIAAGGVVLQVKDQRLGDLGDGIADDVED